ncbi:MAG: hypothetical protein [Anelloviridae sp.]|nr:MAG: hypothetical protein [Anelloviridae sp.]
MADKNIRVKGYTYVISHVSGSCYVICGSRPRHVTRHVGVASRRPFCITKWRTSFLFFKNNVPAAARALRARAGGLRPPPPPAGPLTPLPAPPTTANPVCPLPL